MWYLLLPAYEGARARPHSNNNRVENRANLTTSNTKAHADNTHTQPSSLQSRVGPHSVSLSFPFSLFLVCSHLPMKSLSEASSPIRENDPASSDSVTAIMFPVQKFKKSRRTEAWRMLPRDEGFGDRSTCQALKRGWFGRGDFCRRQPESVVCSLTYVLLL